MFSGDWHEDSLQWLLHKFSSKFVSRDDLQVVLRDLELQILRNISHHISVTKQTPTPETIAPAVREAGLSGITEAVSGWGWPSACAGCMGPTVEHPLGLRPGAASAAKPWVRAQLWSREAWLLAVCRTRATA